MSDVCKVDGCPRDRRSRDGYCNMHTHRVRSHGDPGPAEPLRDKGFFPETKLEQKAYWAWRGMVNRCESKTNRSYKMYGARGITVCSEWRWFKNFLNDMGAPPSHEASIDRIDNTLGYFPSNCRWATSAQQTFNRLMQKNNTSGFKGVQKVKNSKRPRWFSGIQHEGKRYHLGTFSSAHEAAHEYNKAAIRNQGDCAVLNPVGRKSGMFVELDSEGGGDES